MGPNWTVDFVLKSDWNNFIPGEIWHSHDGIDWARGECKIVHDDGRKLTVTGVDYATGTITIA